MNTLQKVAAVILALSTIIGGGWALEQHWTPRTDFAEMGKAFQQHQVEQSLERATDRLWSVEDRLKKDPRNEELLIQKRELLDRKYRLEQKLNSIEKQGG